MVRLVAVACSAATAALSVSASYSSARKRVGDVAEGADDGRAILRVGLLEPGLRRALPAASAPPSMMVCRALPPTTEPARPGPNSVPSAERLGVDAGIDHDVGELVGDATPTSAEAEWRLDFGRAHVGPLLDHLRRQAERQLLRQAQVGQPEALDQRLVGQPAGQGGEQVALLGQCLLQRRQGRLDLGEGGLLGGDVGAGHRAQARLAVQDVERVALGGDDALGRLDLGAQRGFEDRRRHDVGGERQIGAFELEALRLGQRVEQFDLPAVGAPQVEIVGERQADA